MRARAALLVLTLGGSALVASSAAAEPCAPPDPPALRFHTPVFVDQHRPGGEPVTVIANDGSIIYSAHLGTTLAYLRTYPDPEWVADYRNQTPIWRSTDDGTTWDRIEMLPLQNMHTATSTGFSDPDFAIDAAGTIYGTEIDLANVSVFSSRDNGQTWPDGDPLATSGDRPWLAARGPDEVYLRVTGQLQKSTDGGVTWAQRTDPPGYGDLSVDPTDPQGLFMGTGNGLTVSRDDGQSWDTHAIPGASNRSAMMSVDPDEDGWVYYGYAQSSGPNNRDVMFAAWNPDTEQWGTPVRIPKPWNGTPMWPWTVAGDGGRAAVGWYEYVPVPGQSGVNELRVFVAVTTNARGSTFECEDGTVIEVPPRFSVADAADRPIHWGGVPCRGTGCNATGDRRLGDFFTINYDKEGRVFVATGDTTLTQAGNLPAWQARPLFIRAEDDAPRLTEEG
jgi:photosystem II stability/assembly factor-like uncharacterized protein